MNLLFICSRNQWRSPTAEKIFSEYPGINTKSAGTASSARIVCNAKHLNWANVIFVMEKKHKTRLMEKFRQETQGKMIIVLEIEDRYPFMDAELIENLKQSVEPYLENRPES